MIRWRAAGASVAMPIARAIMATPAAMRSGRCRAFRLAAMPDPARATASSGIDTPTAKEMARPTMRHVNWPLFEATMTDVRTGPAQGTKAAPSTSPRPKPAPSPAVRGAMRAKGRSRISMTFGTIMPTPTAASSTMPAQRIAVCGRWSRLSSADPATVISMNEVTRPATISRGRRATLGESSAVLRAATAGVLPPPRETPGATRKSPGFTVLVSPEDEAVAVFADSFPPAAPRNRTGRTGRMHGEMPVTRPPSRPSKRNIGSPYLEMVDNARDMVPEGVKTLRLGLVLI